MLNFMREKAQTIMLTTVILFILSLFGIGTYSLFSNRGKDSKSKADATSSLATLDGVPLDEAYFNRQFNQMFGAIPEDKRILLDPDIIDYYRFDALQKTISYQLMMREAEKQGIKALPQEVSYRIEQIAKMYQIKSVGELKRMLAEHKVPWSEFKRQQRDEIVVAKFMNGITGRISVAPADIKMAFIEIKARHILINPDPKITDNVEADMEALKKAESLYEMVLANRSKFADIAKKFSDDKTTAPNGGDLGWISRGQMVPEFEKQLYMLKPGEIAGPVKTMFGYHIILVEDRKDKEIPKGVTEKDVENQILQEKQAEAVRKWMRPLQDSANVVIFEPALKAYDFRTKNDYMHAMIEYQKEFSSQPQNLLLYVQIARMYDKLDRVDDAMSVFQKAMIYQKYNSQYQYPMLYFSYVEFLKKQNKLDMARDVLDTMFKYFKDKPVILDAIVTNFDKVLEKKKLDEIKAQLDVLTQKKKAPSTSGQDEDIKPFSLSPTGSTPQSPLRKKTN